MNFNRIITGNYLAYKNGYANAKNTHWLGGRESQCHENFACTGPDFITGSLPPASV